MYARILVPIDGSATGNDGLSEAIDLAKQLGSKLVLLHVVEDFAISLELASVASFEDTRAALHEAGRSMLDKAASRAAASGVLSETVLNEQTAGRASDAILKQAKEQRCELIVMGTHGRRGLDRVVMGSDAELVLRGAAVPVLMVRHPH